MFRNVPQTGSRIKAITSTREFKLGDEGTLRAPLADYYVDRAEDLFEAEFFGRIIVVRRGDVELT